MDGRLFSPSTQRNSEPIGKVLSQFLPKNGFVLEIASGTGEHGVKFQERFPNICWQTSDPDPLHRKSISAWIKHQGLTNRMPEPIDLDVEKNPWPLIPKLHSSIKTIICINMIHISPWRSTQALFAGAKNLLKKDEILMLYGPFKRNGTQTSESNWRFDKSLRAQNAYWGIRNLEEVMDLGIKNGLEKPEIIEMPTNNLSVVFRKTIEDKRLS